MSKRTIGNVLAGAALVMFVLTIIGMLSGQSHRWVEPLEAAGWMLLVSAVLVIYLVAAPAEAAQAGETPAPGRPGWATAAWVFGGLAIVLLLVSLVLNASIELSKYWFEGIEVAGMICVAMSIVSVLVSRGGGENSKE